MSIIFSPEDHKYISSDGEAINWTSVTSFISEFKKPFDSMDQSQKSSKKKNSKWYGLTPDTIRQLWAKESKRATDLGNFYHDQRERDLCGLETLSVNGTVLPIVKPTYTPDGKKLAPSQKLSEGVYPEHMVYLKSAGICGQSDLVQVYDGKVYITDYKTNKEIKTEGYKSWDGISQRMLDPLGHLDDCHLNHYALQLSTYLYIIIKHNPSLQPGGLLIHHVQFEEVGRDDYDYPITAVDNQGNPILKAIVPYELPYLKQEVITILNLLRDRNAKNISNQTKAA